MAIIPVLRCEKTVNAVLDILSALCWGNSSTVSAIISAILVPLRRYIFLA